MIILMCCFNKVNLSAILLVRKRIINKDCTVKNNNEPVILPEIATSTSIQGSFMCRKSVTWD